MRSIALAWILAVLGLLVAGCVVSQREYQKVENQLVEESKKSAGLRAALDEAKLHLDMRARQINAEQERASGLRVSVEAKGTEIEELQRDLAELKRKLDEVEKERDVLRARLSKTNAILDVARKDIASNQGVIDGLNKQIADLRGQLDTAKKEVQAAKKAALASAKPRRDE